MELNEGDPCPTGCGSLVRMPPVEGCSCHISPPCSACTDRVLTCTGCGWVEQSAPLTPTRTAVNADWWRSMGPPYSRDLGGGKRLVDYNYDSSSGSTMVYTGRYEGPVTAQDIIDALGDGTFGHRGPTLAGGRFAYTKITD